MKTLRLLSAALSLAVLMLAGSAATLTSQTSEQRLTRSPAGTLLYSTTTQVCTTAVTTEETLATWNLPANTLNENGKALRITAWGTTAANGNTKTVNTFFNSVQVAGGITTSSAANWRMQVTVVRTTSTTHASTSTTVMGGSTAGNAVSSPTANTATALAIRIAATNGIASANDICFKGLTVELLQSTTGIITGTGGQVSNPLLLPNGSASAPAFSFSGDTNTGFYTDSADVMRLSLGGTGIHRWGPTNYAVYSDTAALIMGSAGDVYLLRDGAANTLAQRNGTNPQYFRIYGTYTDGSNNERAQLQADSAGLTIVHRGNGAGTTRDIVLGNTLKFLTDNTYDIGASGANRPRHLFVGSNAYVGSSILSSTSTGVLLLRNAAADDFSRLQFGGTTSSFPALKRSGTSLRVALADDSALAPLAASSLSPSGAAITAGSGTGVTVDSTGTLQRVVYKVTVTKDAFVCNATTCDVTIATLPAKTVVLGTYGELTQTFACTGVCTSSTLSMTLGVGAGTNNLLISFDADAGVANFGNSDGHLGSYLARATAVQGGTMHSWTATGAISLRLTSGTGNIGNGSATNLSQGSITFYIVTERLP